MARFQMSRRVRFADTDPAGIIYFPRYFVMTNDLVEEWFADTLGLPYQKIFQEGVFALTLLRVEAKFSAPSRIGDMLDFSLAVNRLGTKSFCLIISAQCGTETRLITHQDIAWGRRNDGMLRAEAIPPDLRARMEQFLDTP